jgi:hypothetical protein
MGFFLSYSLFETHYFTEQCHQTVLLEASDAVGGKVVLREWQK